MNIKTHRKRVAPVLMALLLNACGSDGEPVAVTPEIEPLTARNSFKVLSKASSNLVDIKPLVSGSTVQPLSIQSQDEQCIAEFEDSLVLRVDQSFGQLCHFDYQVIDKHNQVAQGELYLYTTEASTAILPDLEFQLIVSTTASIELDTVLGSRLPSGYVLVQDSIKLFSSTEHVSLPVVTDANTMELVVPREIGSSELLYNVRNPENPSEVMLGRIFLTYVEALNEGPVITPTNYDYSTQMGITLEMFDVVEIDLGNLTGLTIDESLPWQLIEVSSMSAEVEVSDPNSTSNKSFRFSAAEPGIHIVRYMLSDEAGALAQGFLSFKVSSKEQTPTWSDIRYTASHRTHYFHAPKLFSQYDKFLNISPVWDSQVENTLAGFDSEEAEIYCDTVGEMPTTLEFSKAYNYNNAGVLDQGSLDHWPKELPYLVKNSNGVGYSVIDISNGEISSYETGAKTYVSCLSFDSLKLEMITHSAIADGAPHPVLTFNVFNPNNEYAFEAIGIAGGSVVPDVTFTLREVSATQSELSISSLQAGQLKIKVDNLTNSSSQVSDTIMLIGNVETATSTFTTAKKHAGTGILDNHLVADGKDVINVTLNVTDENDNPLTYEVIDFHENANTVYSDMASHLMFTNDDGEVMIPMKASRKILPEGTYIQRYNIPLFVNGIQQTAFFDVVSDGYYLQLVLEDAEIDGVIRRGRIKILDSLGKPHTGVARMVQSGRQGIILHVVGMDVPVTSFDIPVDGTDIFVASVLTDGRTINSTFYMNNSPNTVSMALDTAGLTRTKDGILFPSAEMNQEDQEAYFADINRVDSFCIERSSESHTTEVYLPDPDRENIKVGQTLTILNQISGGVSVYQEDQQLLAMNSGWQRTFYWAENQWILQNNSNAALFDSCEDFVANNTQ